MGARPQRLGERLLQRGRALDEHELAQLPLRLVRSERAHDGRQAAARPVGPGPLGPGVRLSFVEHPRPPGAHGRRDSRTGLRPDAPPVGAHGRLRGRARAGGHADHGRDLALQQPRRAAGALLRGRPVVPRARPAGRAYPLDRPRGGVRRPRLRDEDGRRPARRARDRCGVALGRAARAPDGAAPAAGRRRRDGRRRRRMAAADDAHAGVEPPVDLGHERQQHPQPDPQLQRPRPPRRPGRRPADRGRRWRSRRWDDVRRRHRPAAPVQRGAGRAGRLAARLRGRRNRRPRGGHTPAARGRPYRLARRHGRDVPLDRRGLQLRPGDLPSLLRGAAGALHGRARGRRVGLVLLAPPCRGDRCGRGPGGRGGDRAARAPQPARPADVAAHRPTHRRRGDGRRPRRGPRAAARRHPRGRPRAAAARPRELGRTDARALDHRHLPGRRPGAGRLRRRPGARCRRPRRARPGRRLRRSPRRRNGPGRAAHRHRRPLRRRRRTRRGRPRRRRLRRRQPPG